MSEDIEVIITLTADDRRMIKNIINVDKSTYWETYFALLLAKALPEPIEPVQGLKFKIGSENRNLREIIAVDGDVVVVKNISYHNQLYYMKRDILTERINRSDVVIVEQP